MKGRCQRFQRCKLNRMRAFSFFGPTNISLISLFLEVIKVKGESA